jgi:two-component system response regulator
MIRRREAGDVNAGSILLVEDNPNDAELVGRALRNAGLEEAIVVVHGHEAIGRLLPADIGEPGEPGPRPFVVLLDLKMPKVDGLDLLARLRADPRTRTLPVVILSSSAEERDVRGAYAAGANSYVVKPVAFDEFMETVALVGRYWLLVNEHELADDAGRAPRTPGAEGDWDGP